MDMLEDGIFLKVTNGKCIKNTLLANFADDILIIFFLVFQEDSTWHFMQIVIIKYVFPVKTGGKSSMFI